MRWSAKQLAKQAWNTRTGRISAPPREVHTHRVANGYEAILDKQLDKRNFRRKMALLKILKPLKEYQRAGRRPAQLFRFAANRFES